MGKIIIVALIVAISVCIALIVFFAIKGKKHAVTKSDSSKDLKDTTEKVGPENGKTGNMDVKPADSLVAEEEEQVKDTSPEYFLLGIQESKLEDIQEDTPESVQEVESLLNPKPVEPRLNPVPVSTGTEATVTNEIGFIRSSKQAEYAALLENIARELHNRAEKSNKIIINYLNDNKAALEYSNGYFMLRNEELIKDGLIIAEADEYHVEAWNMVTVRFCVNFSLPNDYSLQLIPLKDALHAKGLLVNELTEVVDPNISLRAVLFATEDCTIAKNDRFFKVAIRKKNKDGD